MPPTDKALRRWAVASLAANMVIIWTGALVRLTKSGLGCPTWPQCKADSYVPTPEQGIFGVIEFSNRMITFVLAAIAIGTAVAAWRAVRARRQPFRVLALSIGVGLGIVAQAVIGGVSVLLQLNPWIVGLHMVASVALIVVTVELVQVVFRLRPVAAGGRLRAIVQGVFWLGLVIVGLGVVVTGAGPNAGDGAATRNGLPLEWAAKVHAWAVWAECVLVVLGAWWSRTEPRLHRLFLGVLACVLFQGVVGYVQYFNGLPIAVVFLHMVGTSLFVVAITYLFRTGAAWRSERRPG